jgi:hypothetical protein
MLPLFPYYTLGSLKLSLTLLVNGPYYSTRLIKRTQETKIHKYFQLLTCDILQESSRNVSKMDSKEETL